MNRQAFLQIAPHNRPYQVPDEVAGDYAYRPASSQTLCEDLRLAHAPDSDFSETIRGIAGQLLLRWFNGEPGRKAMAVVSLLRGDGRSHIAGNLAIALSQFGRRTLLIDADLRRPSQHRLFNLSNDCGLGGMLAGRGNAPAIVPIQAYPELDVLPAGLVSGNPLALLSSTSLAELVAQTTAEYDAVIFDTTAACSGIDAQLVAARAGASMVVARNHVTPRASFAEMVQILRRSGCALLGSVLNDPPSGQPDRHTPGNRRV